jgi:hypothetical protein
LRDLELTQNFGCSNTKVEPKDKRFIVALLLLYLTHMRQRLVPQGKLLLYCFTAGLLLLSCFTAALLLLYLLSWTWTTRRSR